MDEKNDIVQYRLQRAFETLEDARILANLNRWNPCVNRIYYACFYAISALLLLYGLSSSKHTGVRSLFNQYFVMTGKTPRKLAQVYNDLFARRQESDYVDFVHFDAEQVTPWIIDAEQFVEHISSLIKNHDKKEY